MQNPFGINAADFRLNIADWIAVAPSDNNDIPHGDIGIAIRAGGAGVVVFHNAWGEVIRVSMSAGEILPTSVRRILSTDTTATDLLVALAARRSSA